MSNLLEMLYLCIIVNSCWFISCAYLVHGLHPCSLMNHLLIRKRLEWENHMMPELLRALSHDKGKEIP